MGLPILSLLRKFEVGTTTQMYTLAWTIELLKMSKWDNVVIDSDTFQEVIVLHFLIFNV